jgi:hypothetical protein
MAEVEASEGPVVLKHIVPARIGQIKSSFLA